MATGDIGVEAFLEAVSHIPIFSISEYSSRLRNAILSAPHMSEIAGYFKPTDDDKKYAQNNCSFGNQDCTDQINRLGVATASVVLSALGDARNFHGLADGTAASGQRDLIVQQLFPWLFLDHVNRGLQDGTLKMSLESLRNTTGLQEAFRQTITTVTFDPFVGREDYHYAQHLLFIYEFFECGGDMKQIIDPTQLKSKDALAKWSANHPNFDPAQDQKVIKKFAGLRGQTSATVFNPTGLASALVSDFLQKLQSSGVIFSETDSSTKAIVESIQNNTFFTPEDNAAYKTQSHSMLTEWQEQIDDTNLDSFWRAGLLTAISEEHLVGGINVNGWFYGEKVLKWIDNIKSTYSYINADVMVHRADFIPDPHARGSGDPIPTCFIPGTQIITDTGAVNIEDLNEGSIILTRASPEQWGVRSSETVKLKAPDRIYGINGENPFFTSGHPFFTTTGLRAIDPEAARAENPWLDIGTLGIGHRLLRLKDDKTYESVEITSLHGVRNPHEFVFGVHLREGLRSYHANGYLVALNYPEITVASIARSLQTFPSTERLRLVSALGEIEPLLRRFGGETILELLKQEAKLPVGRYGGKPGKIQVVAQDISKPYIAYDRSSGEVLAQLHLYSGVLQINGEYCERASFQKNSLTWTRKLQDDRWEHGWCSFNGHGIRANGRLFRSLKADPSGEEINQNLHRFYLVPGVDRSLVPGSREDSGSAAKANDQSQTEVAASKRVTRLADSNSSKAGVGDSIDSGADEKVETEHRVQFLLKYDPAQFDTKINESQWAPSISLGTTSCAVQNEKVAYITLVIDQYEQIQEAMIQHAKSKLQNNNSNKIFDKTSSFVEVYDTEDSKNRTVFEFQTKDCSNILTASDQYQTWIQEHPEKPNIDWDEMPLRDLTFTNIGMDASFKLPLLISRMRLWLDVTFTKVNGVASEYNPLCPDNNGASHWISGSVKEIDMPSLTKVMASIPDPIKQPSKSSGDSGLSVNDSPAPVAAKLSDTTYADDEENAASLMAVAYNQSEINAAVQRTIGNIMSYHLEDKVRETFMGTSSKPTNVPIEYGTDLDTTTKDWLKNTYGPAYICMMLTNNDSIVAADKRFDETQKKRVRYFWNGKGASCLSRSKIFHTLERSVTRYEIRKRYDVVRDAFKDAATGIRLSDKIFELSTSPLALGAFGTEKSANGTSRVTRLAAIMDALDNGNKKQVTRSIGEGKNKKTLTINDTNSNQLTFKVMSHQAFVGWNKPYWGDLESTKDTQAAELEKNWYQEAMTEMVRQILDHEQKVDNENGVQVDAISLLQQDISDWAKENLQNWDKLDVQQRAKLVVEAFDDKIVELGKIISSPFTGIKNLAGRIANARCMQNWGRARAVAEWISKLGDDKIIEGAPKRSLGPSCRAGLLGLLGAAAVGFNIWQLATSDGTESTDRMGLMITGLLGCVKQVGEFGLDIVENIIKYRITGPQNFLDPVAQKLIDARLSTAMEEFGSSEVAIANQTAANELTIENLGRKNVLLQKLERQSAAPLLNELDVYQFERQQRLAQNLTKTKGHLVNLEVEKELGEQKIDVLTAEHEKLEDLQKVAQHEHEEAQAAIDKEELYKNKIGVGRTVLMVIGYLVSVAMAIFMTWQLIENWETLEKDTPLLVLTCIQTALAVMEGVFAAIILVPGIVAAGAWALGFVFAAAGTFAVTAGNAFMAMASLFAGVMMWLALLGALVMLALFIYLLVRAPPENPATEFMRTVGLPFASREDLTPPENPTVLTIEPGQLTSDQTLVQEVKLKLTNRLNKDVDIKGLQVQFSSGKKNSSLFYDNVNFVPNTDQSAGSFSFTSNLDSSTGVSCIAASRPTDLAGGNFLNIVFFIENGTLGQKKFSLRAGEVFTLTLHGTVYGLKDDHKDVFPTISLEQQWDDEDVTEQIPVTRVCVEPPA